MMELIDRHFICTPVHNVSVRFMSHRLYYYLIEFERPRVLFENRMP